MTQKSTANYSQFTTDVFCCQSAGIAAVAAEAAAEKEAAWQRYVNLAGRTADGGLVASRQIFESTWQRHLAQRAIAESLAPATG